MRHATWRLAACLCGVLASVSLNGGPLEDFRDLVDNRLAIRSSLGVRSARALDNQRVEVVIGLSATRAAANPESWRIISYDDPNYVYEKFVKPSRATVRREREAQGVTGSPFPEYQRTIVTLTLPEPLKPGVQYYAMGQGVNGEMVTAAHTSAGFVYQAESAPPKWDDPAVHQAVLGLRQVEPVGPGIIRLEFGTNFSAQAAANLDNYKLSIAGRSWWP